MTAALSVQDKYNRAPVGPVAGEPHTSTAYRNDLGQLSENITWLFNRMAALIGTWVLIEAVETVSNNITITAHAIADDTKVRVKSIGGTIPAGLSETTIYYWQVVDSNNGQLAASAGGSSVDITSVGSGTLYLYQVTDAGDQLFGEVQGSIPAGSLNSKLAYLRDNWGKLGAANLWTALQTFSGGGIAFSGITSWTGVKWRVEKGLADSTQTIQLGAFDEFALAAPAGVRTYTVAITAPVPPDGARTRIKRPVGGGNDILIHRTGAALIATLPASTACEVDLIVQGGVVRGSFAGDGAVRESSW